MPLNKQEQQQYLRELREEKLKDLENIEEATDKFFNNKKDDTTISN